MRRGTTCASKARRILFPSVVGPRSVEHGGAAASFFDPLRAFGDCSQNASVYRYRRSRRLRRSSPQPAGLDLTCASMNRLVVPAATARGMALPAGQPPRQDLDLGQVWAGFGRGTGASIKHRQRRDGLAGIIQPESAVVRESGSRASMADRRAGYSPEHQVPCVSYEKVIRLWDRGKSSTTRPAVISHRAQPCHYHRSSKQDLSSTS